MDLNKTNRRQETALAERKHFAIINAYGTKTEFVQAWVIDELGAKLQNLKEFVKMPSVIEIYKTYGNSIKELLRYNLSACVASMGLSEKISASEIDRTAQMILYNNNFRVLNWAVASLFFVKLLTGSVNLYGVTPYAIMRSVDEYAKDAIWTQNDLEREHRHANKAPHNHVKWSDFAQKHPNLASL